jgi:hypothetical protein
MATTFYNFGPVLDQVLATVKLIQQHQLTMEAKMAEDFTHLNQALVDLKAEVTAGTANMDKLFADLQTALTTGNQAAVDAATAAVQAEIDNLKAAVARDPAP